MKDGWRNLLIFGGAIIGIGVAYKAGVFHKIYYWIKDKIPSIPKLGGSGMMDQFSSIMSPPASVIPTGQGKGTGLFGIPPMPRNTQFPNPISRGRSPNINKQVEKARRDMEKAFKF